MNNSLVLKAGGTLSSDERNFSNDFFKKFINDKKIKKKTFENYIVFLRVFVKWIKENNISNPTREDIREYQKYLDKYISKKTKKPLEETTKQQYFQVVKTFFQFLEAEELYKNITRGIESFKYDKQEERKRAFTEEEVLKILTSIDRTTEKGKRDFAMILLCVTGGLRIIELQRANIEDIETIDNEKVLYIQGKGKDTKNYYVKLFPELAEAVEDYLATRKYESSSEPLFTSTSNRSKNTRISETSISRLLKTTFKDCGFNSKKLTPHSLRHSSNYFLYEEEKDIEKVRQHARHSNIATTQIYVNHSERKNNNFEKEIYCRIFKKDCEKSNPNIQINVDDLTEEELQKLSQFIKNLKEESV